MLTEGITNIIKIIISLMLYFILIQFSRLFNKKITRIAVSLSVCRNANSGEMKELTFLTVANLTPRHSPSGEKVTQLSKFGGKND